MDRFDADGVEMTRKTTVALARFQPYQAGDVIKIGNEYRRVIDRADDRILVISDRPMNFFKALLIRAFYNALIFFRRLLGLLR